MPKRRALPSDQEQSVCQPPSTFCKNLLTGFLRPSKNDNDVIGGASFAKSEPGCGAQNITSPLVNGSPRADLALGTGSLIIVFIDDVSDTIISWQVLPDKKPSTAAIAFAATLDRTPNL
jgi:hypothetical protein